jgi:hypothetical protein
MADPNWLLVERWQGRMRRVTVLDDELNVIAMHDRGIGPADPADDECECELLRAVELERLAQTA